MAVRSLEQILGELGSIYDPQVNSARQQQALIPQQVADEERALGAQQTRSFEEIIGGARRRGLGYSGLPIAEQAKYNATEYMPALARLRGDARKQTLSLEDAILGINERRQGAALGLRQQDVDNDYRERSFAEDVRRFNQQIAEQRRAAAAASAQSNGLASLFSGGQGRAPAAANMTTRKEGGFAFTNQAGQPISAAKYAEITGQPIGQVLFQMAQQGDTYASNAYRWIQSVQNSDAFKRNGTDLAKRNFNALFWDI